MFLLSNGIYVHNTVISLYVSTVLAYKTLVVVDRRFIMDQWIEEIQRFTDARVGIIRGKQVDATDKDIVVATIQSISRRGKYRDYIFQQFGTVIFDEGHHIASRCFSNCPRIMQNKYVINLSATYERNDQLTDVIKYFCGEPLLKPSSQPENPPPKRQPASEINIESSVKVLRIVYKNDLKSNEKLFRTYLSYRRINGRQVYDSQKIATNLGKIPERNALIVEFVRQFYMQGRAVLVLSERVQHLTLLHKQAKATIDEGDDLCSLFVSSTTQIKRKEMVENSQIIFATYQIASEAMNIPRLDTLILASPKRDVKQACGRIKRRVNAHFPLIVDIDDQLDSLSFVSCARKDFYQLKGNEVRTKQCLNSWQTQDVMLAASFNKL